MPSPGRKPRVKRSPHWPAARRAHLKAHPACEACGGTERLEVHHERPYHLHPDLELVESNLVTLCEKPGRNCHLWFGHAGQWRGYNPHVRQDAATYRRRVAFSRKVARSGGEAE